MSKRAPFFLLLILLLFTLATTVKADLMPLGGYPPPSPSDPTFYSDLFDELINIKAAAINFFINGFFILIFYLVAGINIALFFKLKSLIRLLLVSILGVVIDLIGLISSTLLIRLFLPKMYPHMTSVLLIWNYPLVALIVFILVSLTFYFIYSKIISLDKKGRLLYSAIFGFLSNPIWYMLYKLVGSM